MTDDVAGLVERLGKMAEALDAYSTFLLANDLDMHPECPEADPEEMAKDAREAAAEIARLRGAIKRKDAALFRLSEIFPDWASERISLVRKIARAALAQQGGDDGK